MNVNIFERTNQIIRECDAAYFGVIDENGFPSVSTVTPVNPIYILEICFSTNIGGNKANRIAKDSRASVCFHSENNNITLVGDAEILTDQETKSRYWKDSFINHYHGGETDPNYCIVRFTAKRVSLWVNYESAEFTVEEFMKVQSRCGLLCNGCDYRESHGCAGCIPLNGIPFWGECPVAKCCQGKGYEHCGECPDIPCDILNGFSCGDSEHSDKPEGARIAVCRAWAGKE